MRLLRIGGLSVPHNHFSSQTLELIKKTIEERSEEFKKEFLNADFMILKRCFDAHYCSWAISSHFTEENFLKESRQLIWEAMIFLSESDYSLMEKLNDEANEEQQHEDE